MNQLTGFLASSSVDNDPILDMFVQAKENKDLALDFLNQEAQMEDLKREFTQFYIRSIDAIDDFFIGNLQQKPSNEELQGKLAESVFDQGINVPCNKKRSSLKRMKVSKNEYVEKILMDFGYQEQGGFEAALYSQRKTMEILDERIQIKLNNPAAKVNKEFSPIGDKQFVKPSNAVTDQNNAQKSGIFNGQPKDKIKIVDMDFLQGFKSLGTQGSQKLIVEASFSKENRNPNVKVENGNISEKDFNDEFDKLKIQTSSSKGSSNLRRSLVPQFEAINIEKGPLEAKFAANEEKNVPPTALEELISSIHHFNPQNKLNAGSNGTSDTSQNGGSEVTKSVLSNQIHQILYSKPMPLDDDSEDDIKPASQGNSGGFYSFDNGYIEDDSIDLNLENDEQYNLTDYSDNSSSNEGSHVFHEEEESIDIPSNMPPMFNFYNQINLNIKNPCPKCQSTEMHQDRCENCNNGQPSNPSNESSKHNLFGNAESQSSHNDISEYEYSQANTVVADYVYYLNQQKANLQQNQADHSPHTNYQQGKKYNKLNSSPMKNKVKRLYCNNKKIPCWASNLAEVEKISKEQKKVFSSNCIFGHFNVDNLDLVDVFQRRDHRFIKPRGSSANWKNEPHTPSTSKPQNGKMLNVMELTLSKTKKNIDFKTYC